MPRPVSNLQRYIDSRQGINEYNRGQSVMSRPSTGPWQPEYEKEPGLEPPTISPDDLIGSGLPTKIAMALKGLASSKMGGLAAATAWHGSPKLFPPTEKNQLGEFLQPTEEGFLGKGIYAGSKELADNYARVSPHPSGDAYLYKIDIPDEHIANFMRTFVPMDQQPKSVQDAARKLYPGMSFKEIDEYASEMDSLPGITGMLSDNGDTRGWLEQGIKGVLHGGSPWDEKAWGDSYSVFDPSIVTILERLKKGQ